MAKKERFGKFVLLEELGSSGLGSEYRAAKLAAGGALERLVLLIRLAPALSAKNTFTAALLEQTKSASLLHGPNILKLTAIGRVESAYYVAYEHLEGRSLKAVLERSRDEGLPFAPDHALAIASKVCAALEYAHGKKDAHGQHVHGLVTSDAVVITHDGEVKLRGFGTWAAGALGAAAIASDERGYLAPEQVKSGVARVETDVHGAGALLFEMLTGQPLAADAAEADPAARVKQARMAAGGDEPLPPPLAEILLRALAREPASRFREMGEMRKAVDLLLYSGEFNPTTFNLAFFMHSLFREEIERDAARVAEERAASYAEYWVEDAARPLPPAVPRPAPAPPATTQPAAVAAPGPALPIVAAHADPLSRPREPFPAMDMEGPPLASASSARHATVSPVPPKAEPSSKPPREPFPAMDMEGPSPTSASSPRHASVSSHPPKTEPKRSPPPLLAIAVVLVIVGGAAAWYFLAGPGARPALPPPTTLSAETIAAQTRVRELEEKLQRFEQEKAQAEAKAAEEAKQKLEAQAKAKGQAVDPAALRKAQDDARLRAQREQDRKQLEEKRLLEEEQRAAEARLAEERRRAAAAAAAAAPPPTLAAAPATTLPPATPLPTAAPPTTLPAAPASATPSAALRPGALVNLADVGVIPPTLERSAPLVYPQIALQQRAVGTVELSVLIDEKGNVGETRIVRGAPGIGLNQAAIDNVRHRKYRPATKDGVPVKVYLSVIVKFEIPR